MAILRVKNKETWNRVWIDARLSNTGTPFNDLVPVTGFPRWVHKEEEFEIDMGDWKELLYRRNLFAADPSSMSDLYRIGMHGRSNVVTGFIWATQWQLPFEYIESTSDFVMPHSIMDDSSGIPNFLTKKCGVDEQQLEIVREKISGGAVNPKILLNEKVRTIKHYLIEPYLKAEGYDASRSASQVFVTVTDQRKNIAGSKLIIESSAEEALSLIDSFVIRNGCLEGKPRKTKSGNSFCECYRSRGFRVPVIEPLSNFFLPENIAKLD